MLILKIRNTILSSYTYLVMLFSIVFFSCNNYGLETVEKNELGKKLSSRTITDIDVFKGVMFLEGDVADLLGDFKEFNASSFVEPEDLELIHELQHDIITELGQSLNYFSNFRTAVTSGNFYTVRTAMQEAADDILDVVTALTSSNKQDILEDAEDLTGDFIAEHSLGYYTSQEDAIDAAKSGRTLHVDTDTFVYVVVVLAAVVAIAAVIGLIIVWPAVDGSDMYLTQSYYSEVAASLDNL